MPKSPPSGRRRRTQTIPPEVSTFLAATEGEQPVPGITASISEFPELAVSAPLALTTDELGWYRLTVVDPATRQPHTGYVRRTWAKDQTLAALGIARVGFDLRRGC